MLDLANLGFIICIITIIVMLVIRMLDYTDANEG